ncbi:MAG: serine/threonine-protein kinase [Candidatus Brocadiia bacterium]
MAEEKKDLSFGSLAIKLLYTTLERVNECVEIQQKIRDMGVKSKKLGEIMIDKSYLTEQQVRHIFRVQGIEGGIRELPGYQILNKVGQGAMGVVYKALQLSMGRTVAIKVLSPQLSDDDKFIKRFFKEARMSAWLNHPNIVQGIDVGDFQGLYYFVMEFVEGLTLEDMVKREGALDEQRAMRIIYSIVQALEHAHKYSLVHRDIKARNILVDIEEKAKLCDLGLAQIAISESESSAAVKGILAGTPAYVSPEQAQRREDLDIRSDIYSLGVTFYFCVVGDLPFRGATALEVVTKHIHENPLQPIERNANISPSVNYIIMKMMAKNRDERYQEPVELMQDLYAVMSGQILIKSQPARPHIRVASRLSRATGGVRRKFRRFQR